MRTILVFAVALAPLIAHSQEAGTAAAYRANQRSQQAATESAINRRVAEDLRKAQSLSDKDRGLLAIAVDKLNQGGGKYTAASDLGSVQIGSLVCVRPYTYVNAFGEEVRAAPSLIIVDVVDSKNAIVEYRLGTKRNDSRKELWLRGIDMGKHIDGDAILLDGFYLIKDKKTYAIEGGGNATIPTIEPYDIASAAAQYDKAVAEKAAKEKEAVERKEKEAGDAEAGKREASFRKWTTADGTHATDARPVSYAGGVITLEKRDRTTVKVAVDKLSDVDREFVKQWRKSH